MLRQKSCSLYKLHPCLGITSVSIDPALGPCIKNSCFTSSCQQQPKPKQSTHVETISSFSTTSSSFHRRRLHYSSRQHAEKIVDSQRQQPKPKQNMKWETEEPFNLKTIQSDFATTIMRANSRANTSKEQEMKNLEEQRRMDREALMTSTSACNLRLNFYETNQDSSSFFRFFATMKEPSSSIHSPDLETYHILFRALLARRSLEYFEETLNELKEKRITFKLETYLLCLEFYSLSNNTKKVLRLYEYWTQNHPKKKYLLAFTNQHINCVLNALEQDQTTYKSSGHVTFVKDVDFVDNFRWSQALTFYNDLIEREILFSPENYYNLILVLRKGYQWRRMLDFFVIMKELKLTVKFDLYVDLLKILQHLRKFEEGEEVLKLMKEVFGQKGIIPFKAASSYMIQFYTELRQLEKVFEVFRDYEQQNFQNILFYNDILTALEKCNFENENFYENIRKIGTTNRTPSCNDVQIEDSLCKLRIKRAEDFLAIMSKRLEPNAQSYETLMKIYDLNKDLKSSKKLFTFLKLKKPNLIRKETYTTMIVILGRNSEHSLVIETYEQMKKVYKEETLNDQLYATLTFSRKQLGENTKTR